MKKSIVSGLCAGVVDIVINIVTDNYMNPIAWLIFIIVVVIAALIGEKLDEISAQAVNIKGKKNKVNQLNSNLTNGDSQKIEIDGDSNRIKQQIR